ncbi:MAG: hypothetical protein GX442_09130 [Candidatus Riflebacteria bacterium]|nr:hypothetical protein [Candidatus Riflebacteria bacterium]
MTTRQRVLKALEGLEDSDLKKIYEVIKNIVRAKREGKKPGFLEKVAGIQIEGPVDFAECHDGVVCGPHLGKGRFGLGK